MVLKCFGPSGKRNGTKRILIENGQRIAACRSTFSLSNQTSINRITNKKVKISLRQSLLLAWFWVTIKDTATTLGISITTVASYFTIFHENVIVPLWNKRSKIGPDGEVQINESLLAGKRKYNRGRLLLSDLATIRDPDSQSRSKNYGNRIGGPWIFGMVGEKKMKMDVNEQQKFVFSGGKKEIKQLFGQ